MELLTICNTVITLDSPAGSMIGTTNASGVFVPITTLSSAAAVEFAGGLSSIEVGLVLVSVSHFPAFGSCSVAMSVVLGFYFRLT